MAVTGAGLEGIVAANREFAYIDGDAGILSYQGYNIHTLADNATFEEVIYLLWNGRLPKQAELDAAEGGAGRPSRDSGRGDGVPEERRQSRADGRAAHGGLDADAVRSAGAGHVARGESRRRP